MVQDGFVALLASHVTLTCGLKFVVHFDGKVAKPVVDVLKHGRFNFFNPKHVFHLHQPLLHLLNTHS
jgi:hypothetical protein